MKERILQALLSRSKDGYISYGDMTQVVEECKRSRWMIQRIWMRYKETKEEEGIGNVDSKIKSACGR